MYSISVFSQNQLVNNYVHNKLPLISVQFSDKEQQDILIAYLIQYYGDNFKYYQLIKEGFYEFRINNDKKKPYMLVIYSDNSVKKIIEEIGIQKISNDNGKHYLWFEKSSFSNLIDNRPFGISLQLKNQNIEILERNNILKDQLILQFEGLSEDYWRILNERFTTDKLVDQYDEESVLFKDVEAGVVVPSGINGENSKFITIDSKFASILYFDLDVFNSEVETSINKTFGSIGHGYGQYFAPSGIAKGREFVSDGCSYTPIFVSDKNNNRITSVVLKINPNSRQLATIDENSFKEITNAISPYDISYYKDMDDSTNDKLWVSSADQIYPSLSCYS